MIRKWVEHLDAYFSPKSPNVNLGWAFLFALVIGGVDYFLPGELYVLYLFPVAFASWYGGASYGLVVAIYAATAILVSDSFLERRFVDPLPPVITFVVRLVSYALMALLVGQLKEAQRLQQQLTEFIVHDIRSPLTSSISGLETLQQISDGMDDIQKEMVELALVGSQRALGLVNGILDVSKLQNGKMEPDWQLVRVEDLVAGAVDDVALWAHTNDVALKVEVRAGEWVLDPTLIRRVMVNLLSNALKFSKPQSQIVIVAESQNNVLRISIADQGPGIPPEFRQSIFEPFSQVKGTKGGTGLGLTFCRLAVNSHGGHIWLESTVGKGTTMIFTLPQQVLPTAPDSKLEPKA